MSRPIPPAARSRPRPRRIAAPAVASAVGPLHRHALAGDRAVKDAAGADARALAAFMVSPLVATALWVMTSFVWLAAIDGLTAAWRDVPTLLVGGLFLGLPVALAVVVLLAGPCYVALLVANRVTVTTTVVSGAAIGAVSMLLLSRFLDSLAAPAVGLVVGAGTAVAWWAIARPRRPPGDRLPADRSPPAPSH